MKNPRAGTTATGGDYGRTNELAVESTNSPVTPSKIVELKERQRRQDPVSGTPLHELNLDKFDWQKLILGESKVHSAPPLPPRSVGVRRSIVSRPRGSTTTTSCGRRSANWSTFTAFGSSAERGKSLGFGEVVSPRSTGSTMRTARRRTSCWGGGVSGAPIDERRRDHGIHETFF